MDVICYGCGKELKMVTPSRAYCQKCRIDWYVEIRMTTKSTTVIMLPRPSGGVRSDGKTVHNPKVTDALTKKLGEYGKVHKPKGYKDPGPWSHSGLDAGNSEDWTMYLDQAYFNFFNALSKPKDFKWPEIDGEAFFKGLE